VCSSDLSIDDLAADADLRHTVFGMVDSPTQQVGIIQDWN
jgi:hypothetical protein